MDVLSLTTWISGRHVVITAVGEIDIATAPQLRQQIAELITAGHRHLVVDLEDVGFMDSTGLAALISGLRRVRAEDGSLHVVCTREAIRKLFRVTGLDVLFPIHDSAAAALAGGHGIGVGLRTEHRFGEG